MGSASHPGRVRTINEDSRLISDRLPLYAVADGMGGHQGGEVASAIAVRTLDESVNEPTLDALVAGVELANRHIRTHASADPSLRGMGTTLCAIVLLEDDEGQEEIGWVNVGDSRIYLFRDDDLIQLSDDHNLVAELQRDGQITDDQAAVHPQRNIITRALGIDSKVLVDSNTVLPYQGDRFLLCSDGLSDELNPDQIAATMRRLADPTDVADDLVRQANDHGGRDNVTCVVVDVVDDGDRAGARVRRAGRRAAHPRVGARPRRRAGRRPRGRGVRAPHRRRVRRSGPGARPARHLAGGDLRARAARDRRRGLRRGELGGQAHVLRRLRRQRRGHLPGPARRSARLRPGARGPPRPRARPQLTAAQIEDVASNPSFGSLADAKSFANTLLIDAHDREQATETTTSTVRTTTTSRPTTTTTR